MAVEAPIVRGVTSRYKDRSARAGRLYDSNVAGDAEFDAFAALLRRGRDVPDMVGHLAERLDRALPDQVEVESNAPAFGDMSGRWRSASTRCSSVWSFMAIG